jgi:hypothetical protein
MVAFSVVMRAAEDHATQAAFGGAVMDRKPRVVEEPGEPREPAEHVGAETALGQRALLTRPGANGRGARRRSVPACRARTASASARRSSVIPASITGH